MWILTATLCIAAYLIGGYITFAITDDEQTFFIWPVIILILMVLGPVEIYKSIIASLKAKKKEKEESKNPTTILVKMIVAKLIEKPELWECGIWEDKNLKVHSKDSFRVVHGGFESMSNPFLEYKNEVVPLNEYQFTTLYKGIRDSMEFKLKKEEAQKLYDKEMRSLDIIEEILK